MGNGSECDFIVGNIAKFIPIQVSYSDLSDGRTRDRELRGLITAMNHLKQKQGLLLTDDLERNEQINDLHIQFKPVWKFLMKSNSINLI